MGTHFFLYIYIYIIFSLSILLFIYFSFLYYFTMGERLLYLGHGGKQCEGKGRKKERMVINKRYF